MKRSIQLWLACEIALYTLATTSPTRAQIVPDATLPVNSSITPQGNTSTITGGTATGGNLFHSFEQFSVPNGSAAYFNNALDIQNIISRVTGSSISNIDGLIQANGTANLFLLNPNGIIFGPNATLAIGGSFLGSTASGLNFADGTQFSATAPQTTPLLTVSVPIGLQFGETAGRIRVQGLGNNLSVDPTTQEFVRGENPGGLQVKPGKTLALIGNGVTLEAGNLIAESGRIEVGSVAGSGIVSLTPTDKGLTLGYLGVPNFQDIHLSQRASVDASGSGGGEIQVQGKDVILTEGSAIFALTVGSNPGGTVSVNASESVQVIRTSADGQFPSAVFTDTKGDGAAGDLTITTGQLLVQDGAVVTADTFGTENAGDLTVNAAFVKLSGTGTVNGRSVPSGLFTTTQGAGDAGELTITTGQLLVLNEAQVSTATLGEGKGGNLAVNASDSVQLSGGADLATRTRGGGGAAGDLTITTGQLLVQDRSLVATDTYSTGNAGNLTVKASDSVQLSGTAGPSTGLLAQVQPGATGNAGNLTIETGQLLVQNGALISAATLGTGNAGNLTIKALESVELSETSKDGQLRPSFLTAASTLEGRGDAGNLRIETGELIVRDGGRVTVLSVGSGKAGELTVEADSISLEDGAKISANTKGEEGNINLLSSLLVLRRGSSITTDATGTATGGNITIDTGVIVALENSDISANALEGPGGRVIIDAQGIFGIEFREREKPATSDITATSELGPEFSGTVEINTPDIDPSRGLATLPAELVDVTRLIAQGCPGSGGDVGRGASEFIITGRGGLPPSPSEAFRSEAVRVDLGASTVPATNQSGGAIAPLPSRTTAVPLVEAQGWVTNTKGEVFLTATASALTPHSPWLPTADCHASKNSS